MMRFARSAFVPFPSLWSCACPPLLRAEPCFLACLQPLESFAGHDSGSCPWWPSAEPDHGGIPMDPIKRPKRYAELADPQARPRYTGISTFFRAPHTESLGEVDIGVIGVP